MMKLLCLGDIAIGDVGMSEGQWMPPGNILLSEKAKVLFNWELPIGNRINPAPRIRGPRLLSHPSSVNVIQKWSPGFAALATNHLLDGGEEGLALTVTTLQHAGFQTVGAGQTSDEIKQPLYWETEEGRLGIINWVFPETHPDWIAVPGPNCWPGMEEAESQISEVKKNSDWLLAFVHWSDELFSYPRPEDREITRQLSRMGANVIIGHHPHVVRGMEATDSGIVFYSLGNFYFSRRKGAGRMRPQRAPRNREGLGIELVFNRGMKPQYKLYSFWQTDNRSIVDPQQRAIRRLNWVSRPLQELQDAEYMRWYLSQRRKFDIYGYRLHFKLWQLGIPGLLLFPFRKYLSR